MDILKQILDGFSFGFLVFAVAAAAGAVYFTVLFAKSRKALKGKEEITDTDRKSHKSKRKAMIILFIVFGVMLDFTLSAFIVRGAVNSFGHLFYPVSTVSKKDGVMEVSPLNKYKVNADTGMNVELRKGSLKAGEETVFSFTAKSTGSYLFRVTEMTEGMEIKINLRDNDGNNIDYASGVKKYTVAPMDYIEKGVRYTVTLTAVKGEGEYEIEIIRPKNFDIKHYSVIKDSIEYNFQSNVYFFTPKTDGVYCFSITDFKGSIGIGVPEAEETLIIDDELVIVGLRAGKVYRVNVNQLSGQGSYTLNVMRQKPVVNISSVTEVNDNFEFYAQQNFYSFTGKTEITLDMETNGIMMSLFILNEDESVIYNIRNFRGYKTVTVKGLSAEKTYRVLVFPTENTGKYKFYVE